MKKRVFSAALAGCMMLTMVPVTAFAAEEGVTEVAVEQYEAPVEKGEITLATLGNADWHFTMTSNGQSADVTTQTFLTDGNKAKLIAGMKAINGVDTVIARADRSGYYLPLIMSVPDADEDTVVVLKKGTTILNGDALTTDVKELTWSNFDVKEAGKTPQIYLAAHIARMDGKILNGGKIEAEVWLDGIGGAKTEADYTMDYPYSANDLVDTAKYKTAELKLYTDSGASSVTFPGTKKASAFYDVRSGEVKRVTSYTDFSDNADMQSGYYLPLVLELDKSDDVVITVQNGGDETKDVTVADDSDLAAKGNLYLLQRIADVNGKKLRNEIKVTVYPQGKGYGLPSQEYTYSLADVKLQDGIVIDADLVDKAAVKVANENEALAIKNNIDAVKSFALKDNVLTITADVKSAVSVTAATTTVKKAVPVLFTMTNDGIYVPEVNATISQYGGLATKHLLRWVCLAPDPADGTGADKKVLLPNGKEVKVEIVDASQVPVLTDSTVTVKDGEMTGLTAQAEAKAVSDIKAMYTANGSVVIKNAAGTRTLKDTDKVGTGCVIILTGADGKEVERVTVIVKGDVLGDGYAHAGQLVALGKAALGVEPLEGVFLEAGNFNDAPGIDAGDIVAVGKLVLAALN